MKKTGLIVFGVVLLLLVLLGGLCVKQYNGFVDLDLQVQETFSNLDTQLQRRADLIPNLVETVKGYASHEQEVFAQVSKAREHLLSANSVSDLSQANEEMSTALGRLLAITEAYPDLKANTLYINLMDELAGTENRLAIARENYNAVVGKYNISIRRFPASLFAGMFGFEKAEFFQASVGSQNAPVVDF